MAGSEEYTLTVRQWDRDGDSQPDWLDDELPRIATMIADGFTSGEIVGPNGERGWWDLSKTESDQRSL